MIDFKKVLFLRRTKEQFEEERKQTPELKEITRLYSESLALRVYLTDDSEVKHKWYEL